MKDALATFDRLGIETFIRSKFCDVTFDRSEKHDFSDVMASSMLGFVWYTLAVIAVFSVRTAVRAWLAIALPTAAIALVCAWLPPAAGSGP